MGLRSLGPESRGTQSMPDCMASAEGTGTLLFTLRVPQCHTTHIFARVRPTRTTKGYEPGVYLGKKVWKEA